MGRSIRSKRSIFPNSTLLATLLICFHSVLASTERWAIKIAETSWQRLQDDGETVGARCESDYGKLKVPFAKPPLAELRFEKPVPPNSWRGIKDATAIGPACFPFHKFFLDEKNPSTHSEDCLHLNVIVPKTENQTAGFPVLVYVHGGGFEVGSAVEFGWEHFADNFVSREVIIVTVQYRLGPLGFAATGDESFPGNLGLWDLHAALKYLSRNIHHFGGDPAKITLWGHSAGSVAVGALSVSTHTHNLFAQTIQMSGALFSEWSASNRVIPETDKLADALKCDVTDSKTMKKCLRGKSIYEILDGVEKIDPGRWDYNFIKFGPRLDADFFTDDFPQLIENAKKKPNMLGVTDSESITFTLFGGLHETANHIFPGKENFTQFGFPEFDKFLTQVVASSKTFGSKSKEVQRKIRDFYLSSADPESLDYRFYLEKYSELISDLMFVVPTLIEARYKTAANWPVYLYLIDYYNKNTYPDYIPVKGSFHGVEYPYLFGSQLVVPTLPFDEQEKIFQRNLVDSIVNFATKSNPSSGSFKWPKLSENALLDYALINGDAETRVLPGLFAKNLKFWQQMRENYDFDIVRGFHKTSLMSRDEL
ncbi:carboxylesterase family domain-containing protein [Ditylenchus destructor]|nr:carboxylesterase family domain-containing protein [Ditylenchus destructor]